MDDIRQYPVEAQNEYHVACVLLLDTSSSMEGPGIEGLNRGLVQFKEDTLTKLRGNKGKVIDIAIVEFNSSVNVVHNFAPLDQLELPVLTASGFTHMGEAIRKALELIEQRKQIFKTQGTPYHRPWIFMITDGEPNDENYDAAFRELQKQEDKKSVMTWAIGVEGYNERLLQHIMPWYEVIIDGVPQKRQRIFKLEGLNFNELFEFLSNSIAKLANNMPGEYKGEELPGSLKPVDNPYGF
jgi:uncharacterized protein YegL